MFIKGKAQLIYFLQIIMGSPFFLKVQIIVVQN